MARAGLCVVILLSWCSSAAAEYRYGNGSLDYALRPEPSPALVVVGEVVPVTGTNGERVKLPKGQSGFGVRVKAVVLGDAAHQGKTLRVVTASFDWPEDLVSREVGALCLFVLGHWATNEKDSYLVSVVAPARDRKYPAVKDNVAARAVAVAEVVAALKDEKEAVRQRALLRQLGPVLRRDDLPAVEGFLKSPDPWVRRAALAALVYATEDAKYLKAAAEDIQAYLKGTKPGVGIEGTGRSGAVLAGLTRTPEGWMGEYYFFLDSTRRSWQADKNLRLLRGLQKTNILDDEVSRRIEEE